jgi:Acetyl-CoA hydrolase/transferase C-terminal domain
VVSERIDEALLAALDADGIGSPLSAAEFESLQRCGVFRRECRLRADGIDNGEGVSCAARLDTAAARRDLLLHCAGRCLSGGVLLDGGFFLGPPGFYAALRDMPEQERRQFWMGPVSFINQLDRADRSLRVAQRAHGRFINTTTMVTLLGAAVSDQLADGTVVSGVGGQYNFVAMAHALPGARSILALRAVREKQGEVTSNLVWNYAHQTIPRHLRDVVVTEYGGADLRGRTDREVIAALLNIADSRFQAVLTAQAQAAGKLPRDYRIPDMHRQNTPAALEERFVLARARGLCTEFPFGTDLTRAEIVLGKALKRLQANTAGGWRKAATVLRAASRRGTPAALAPFLERTGLARPATRSEWLWQRLLVQELREIV